jgi:hypothetical protein
MTVLWRGSGRARGAAAATAALLVVAAGAACGRARHHAAPTSPSAVATVRTADCTTWQQATDAQRQLLVDGMATFFGAPVDSGGGGNTLSSARARHVFDAGCARPASAGFRLYRLYGDAVAFSPPAG